MIEAIENLKNHGLKLALLTNNWKTESGERLLFDGLSLFDHVIESCKVGMRKPQPEIYNHTLSLLNLPPAETIFLDDIGSNVKAANDVGIDTIKVASVPAALGD